MDLEFDNLLDETILPEETEEVSSNQEVELPNIFKEEEIVDIKKLTYLKSRNTAITKLLYVQELL